MPTELKFMPSVLTSTVRPFSVLSEDCACADPAANRHVTTNIAVIAREASIL